MAKADHRTGQAIKNMVLYGTGTSACECWIGPWAINNCKSSYHLMRIHTYAHPQPKWNEPLNDVIVEKIAKAYHKRVHRMCDCGQHDKHLRECAECGEQRRTVTASGHFVALLADEWMPAHHNETHIRACLRHSGCFWTGLTTTV